MVQERKRSLGSFDVALIDMIWFGLVLGYGGGGGLSGLHVAMELINQTDAALCRARMFSAVGKEFHTRVYVRTVAHSVLPRCIR